MATRTAQAGLQTSGGAAGSTYANSVAGGWIGHVEVTANQTGISAETDLTGLSVAVTVNASRRIKVSAHAVIGASVSGNRYALRIKESTTVLQNWVDTVDTVSASGSTAGPMKVLTPSAGSHTYKLSLELATGSGSISLVASTDSAATLLVEDIGPAS